MINIQSLKLAKTWVESEIKTGRPLISLPEEMQDLKSLTNQKLSDMAAVAPNWTFTAPVGVMFPKHHKGEYREAHYIPVRDRVLLMAALLQNYDAIYQAVETMVGADFARPLRPSATDAYLNHDYHDQYKAFKDHIAQEESEGKWIVHTDIRNFAGACRPEHVLNAMRAAGCDEGCIALFDKAMTTWAQTSSCKGIPQGYAITDFLLKLYLENVDVAMTHATDASYVRYVDDIIISAPSKELAKDALHELQGHLAAIGLSLKETETYFAAPDEKAKYGHAYRPESQIEGLKTTFNLVRSMHPAYKDLPEPSHQDLLLTAYERFMSPKNQGHEVRPKYLFSYLLREMKAHDVRAFVKELPALIDENPDCVGKILRAAVDMPCDALPLNGLAMTFFGQESDDAAKDGMRLEYLKVLDDNNYPISQFDLLQIQSGLERIKVERPLFEGYAQTVNTVLATRFKPAANNTPKRVI